MVALPGAWSRTRASGPGLLPELELAELDPPPAPPEGGPRRVIARAPTNEPSIAMPASGGIERSAMSIVRQRQTSASRQTAGHGEGCCTTQSGHETPRVEQYDRAQNVFAKEFQPTSMRRRSFALAAWSRIRQPAMSPFQRRAFVTSSRR